MKELFATLKQKLTAYRKKVTTAYLAKVAIMSALSFVLYFFAKFPLPFMFPSFLDMQFSELPAILAGFSLGPTAGVIVILVKCLLKFPFSGTGYVGETMDIFIGISYVLTASLIYNKYKDKKHAVIGMAVGSAVATVVAMIFNRVVAIPFYTEAMFGGDFNIIVNMCRSLYPKITADNFYYYYLFVAVLPFNILRIFVVSVVTFFVYKRLSKLLHMEFPTKKPKNTATTSPNAELKMEKVPEENVEEIPEEIN